MSYDAYETMILQLKAFLNTNNNSLSEYGDLVNKNLGQVANLEKLLDSINQSFKESNDDPYYMAV